MMIMSYSRQFQMRNLMSHFSVEGWANWKVTRAEDKDLFNYFGGEGRTNSTMYCIYDWQ